MRRVSFVCSVLLACAIFATPVAAQEEGSRWLLRGLVGPAFGTLGTATQFDAEIGYKVNDMVAVVWESGVLSHAPFDKARDISAPPVEPSLFANTEYHVNGFHHNANLKVMVPMAGRVSPYVTGGVGSFVGSTVERGDAGPTTLTRYASVANFASNVGGGFAYQVSRWVGVIADYRLFIVNADETENVSRFTIGLALFGN